MLPSLKTRAELAAQNIEIDFPDNSVGQITAAITRAFLKEFQKHYYNLAEDKLAIENVTNLYETITNITETINNITQIINQNVIKDRVVKTLDISGINTTKNLNLSSVEDADLIKLINGPANAEINSITGGKVWKEYLLFAQGSGEIIFNPIGNIDTEGGLLAEISGRNGDFIGLTKNEGGRYKQTNIGTYGVLQLPTLLRSVQPGSELIDVLGDDPENPILNVYGDGVGENPSDPGTAVSQWYSVDQVTDLINQNTLDEIRWKTGTPVLVRNGLYKGLFYVNRAITQGTDTVYYNRVKPLQGPAYMRATNFHPNFEKGGTHTFGTLTEAQNWQAANPELYTKGMLRSISDGTAKGIYQLQSDGSWLKLTGPDGVLDITAGRGIAIDKTNPQIPVIAIQEAFLQKRIKVFTYISELINHTVGSVEEEPEGTLYAVLRYDQISQNSFGWFWLDRDNTNRPVPIDPDYWHVRDNTNKHAFVKFASFNYTFDVYKGNGILIDKTDRTHPVISIDPDYFQVTAGIEDIIEGIGIDIDKSDPKNPIISVVFPAKLTDVAAGSGIAINKTNPLIPVISSTITQGITDLTAGSRISIDKTNPLNPLIQGADMSAGTGVSINKANPLNPVISSTITQGITDLTAGAGISINKTNPLNPVVSSTITQGITNVSAGQRITIDKTNPLNPVFTGADMSAGFGVTIDKTNPLNPVIAITNAIAAGHFAKVDYITDLINYPVGNATDDPEGKVFAVIKPEFNGYDIGFWYLDRGLVEEGTDTQTWINVRDVTNTFTFRKFAGLFHPSMAGVIDITAGTGISINKTNPANPIITASGTQGLVDITAGSNISINKTNPLNPVINANIPTTGNTAPGDFKMFNTIAERDLFYSDNPTVAKKMCFIGGETVGESSSTESHASAFGIFYTQRYKKPVMITGGRLVHQYRNDVAGTRGIAISYITNTSNASNIQVSSQTGATDQELENQGWAVIDNVIYYHKPVGGLHYVGRYDITSGTHLADTPAIANPVFSIAKQSSGTMLFGSVNGFYRYTVSSNTLSALISAVEPTKNTSNIRWMYVYGNRLALLDQDFAGYTTTTTYLINYNLDTAVVITAHVVRFANSLGTQARDIMGYNQFVAFSTQDRSKVVNLTANTMVDVAVGSGFAGDQVGRTGNLFYYAQARYITFYNTVSAAFSGPFLIKRDNGTNAAFIGAATAPDGKIYLADLQTIIVYNPTTFSIDKYLAVSAQYHAVFFNGSVMTGFNSGYSTVYSFLKLETQNWFYWYTGTIWQGVLVPPSMIQTLT